MPTVTDNDIRAGDDQAIATNSVGAACPVYAIYFRPPYFVSRTGLEPLAEVVGARKIIHRCFWDRTYRLNWRLGNLLKKWGQGYYRSDWNGIMPVWDEIQIARRIKPAFPCIAHFLFSEFAGPRWTAPFRRRGALIAGTFHASVRRQQKVSGNTRLDVYDRISVVSKVQKPFFVERGYPADRIHVILHGVDTDYFTPLADRKPVTEDAPLNGLMVGDTERDHEFAATLMKSMPEGILHLSVATRPYLHGAYRDARNVTLLPHQSDTEMLRKYQEADLLVLPLIDSTANNALLESMACGTPVLTTRVGGTPEYVDTTCGMLVDKNKVEDWVDALSWISSNRNVLASWRKPARAWAEQLSWKSLAPQYLAMYQAMIDEGGPS